MGLRKKRNLGRGVKISMRLKKGNKRLPVRKTKIIKNEEYDKKKTLIENYKKMGIILNSNNTGKAKDNKQKGETAFVQKISNYEVLPSKEITLMPIDH